MRTAAAWRCTHKPAAQTQNNTSGDLWLTEPGSPVLVLNAQFGLYRHSGGIASANAPLVFHQQVYNHYRGLPSTYEESRDAVAPQAGQL